MQAYIGWMHSNQSANQMGHISVNAQCLGVYDCKQRLSLGLRPRGREVYSHKPLYTVH